MNDLTNIPFETLPLDTLRRLCERGVKAINTDKGRDMDLVEQVSSLDAKIIATIALSNPHGKDIWGPYKTNKDACLTLIDTYVAMKNESTHRYIGMYDQHIDNSIVLDKDIIERVLNARSEFGNTRLSGDPGIFGRVRVGALVEKFNDSPVAICQMLSAFPSLLGRIWNEDGIPAEKRVEIAKAVVGFAHKWDNDTPAMLKYCRDGMRDGKKGMSQEFDEVMLHLCTICRKDEANMKRIKMDMDNSIHGGKASRHKMAGWLTEYMKSLWELRRIETIKMIVQNVPPVTVLLPCQARSQKDLRSFFRLYQISGDV